MLPNAPTNAALPILFAATSTGLFLATVWAAVTGQNAAAGIYGIFGGLNPSYALLLGMAHNWLGINPVSYTDTAKVFLTCWLAIVTMLILATLRLPVIFTALFTLVDLTLLLSLLQQIHNSTGQQKATGWSALAVATVGICLFISTSFHATGGKELPAGKPDPAQLTPTRKAPSLRPRRRLPLRPAAPGICGPLHWVRQVQGDEIAPKVTSPPSSFSRDHGFTGQVRKAYQQGINGPPQAGFASAMTGEESRTRRHRLRRTRLGEGDRAGQAPVQ